MYENLLSLPYFQGMNQDDITAILDKVIFEFIKYNEGESICNCGEDCDKFIILTQGTIQAITESPDKSYKITEEIVAPYAIEPHSMFGYNTKYKRTYIAKERCSIIAVKKKFLFTDFIKHKIFTINLLNLISHKSEIHRDIIWNNTPDTIAGRIVKFISLRCEQQHGRKILSIKMERIAEILCETRLNVSKSLNQMQEDGLLELHRKEIIIPSLRKLIDSIEK